MARLKWAEDWCLVVLLMDLACVFPSSFWEDKQFVTSICMMEMDMKKVRLAIWNDDLF